MPKKLLEPEYLGDGVYIYDEDYQIVLAVNHHTNKVICMGENEVKRFIQYVKRSGLIKE